MEMEAVSKTFLSQQCFITEENSFEFENNLIESLCHDFCCDECTSNDFCKATGEMTKNLENHIFCCDENTYKVFMHMNAETRETSAETSTNLSIHHVTAADEMSVKYGHQKDENHSVAKATYKSKYKKTKKKKQKEKLAKLMQKYKPPEGKCRNTSRYAESFQELLSPRGMFSEIGSTLTCPVCLELYFRPHVCHPCQHIFCEPCLRKLTTKSTESVPCPLCRKVIRCCSHDKDLDQRLKVDYPDIYQERARIEKFCKSRYNQLPLTIPLPFSRRLLQSIIQDHRARRCFIDWLYGLVYSSLAYLLPLGFGFSMSFLLFLYNGKLAIESQVESANTCILVMVLGLILAYIMHKLHLLRFVTLNRQA
ncbi:hypothetical protein CHS0354_036180 [Potamilus streckersoni]|uniref:RING-type domain-containing protein n=1 Tax=Potamilus streckersoni TaxID=2493646 RepID=A0AAE0W3A0_9BIVA|nr:hypothetical protein CHS0354_036180 [Potamilus streckersoni]